MKVRNDNEEAIAHLDKNIDILENEIKNQAKELQKINEYDNEQNKHGKLTENKEEICKYYNRGYCRNKTLCLYTHPKDVCKLYVKEGECSVMDCSSRHPKTCRYWKRGYCYRGDLCEFGHDATEDAHNEKENVKIINCDNCNEGKTHLYYCEFCSYNFCIKCTVEEAHDKSYPKSTKIAGCMQIHYPVTNVQHQLSELNVNDEMVDNLIDMDNSIETENCQCGKPNKSENFKCKDCEKYFCEKCPSGPIENNCLECIMVEAGIVSSTPIKKQE